MHPDFDFDGRRQVNDVCGPPAGEVLLVDVVVRDVPRRWRSLVHRPARNVIGMQELRTFELLPRDSPLRGDGNHQLKEVRGRGIVLGALVQLSVGAELFLKELLAIKAVFVRLPVLLVGPLLRTTFTL